MLFLTEAAPGGGMSMILVFVVVIVIMYFLMIRPEKKKQKKVEEMRSALKVGDNITTIGGIVGDIVSVKDGKDGKIVIETSSDRVRIELEKWSVSTNNSAAAAEEYGLGYDLVAGANIAGFIKVADAMIAQGVL